MKSVIINQGNHQVCLCGIGDTIQLGFHRIKVANSQVEQQKC